MFVRAVLFDYGGTLDGGVHWLERFAQLYRASGFALPFERLRAAFDYATRCAYDDPGAAELDLQALVEYHVARQSEHLGLSNAAVAGIVAEFVRASRAGLDDSRIVLARLHGRAALGVISNFYGNVHRILDEAKLAPLLTIIIDSAVVGVKKPDPEIFALAVRRIGCEPAQALYVGDSFENDVVGAHAAGLRTAWLVGTVERPCRLPECVDIRLRRLADLDGILDTLQDEGAPAARRLS